MDMISDIDPLGLSMWEDAKSGACTNGLCGTLSAMIGPDKFDSIDSTAYDALNKINSQSICEDKEFAGLICKDNSGRYFSTAPNRGERNDHIHSIALALMVLRKYQLIILMVQIVMENIGTKYFQVKMRK